MAKDFYVMLAPIELKDGVDEAALIAASDAFEVDFASRHKGIVRRLLLRAEHGGYADLVFFESKADADRVAQAEAASAACMAYFKIMKTPDEGQPDMGVLGFEHVKTYE
jgi:hypothetical protein